MADADVVRWAGLHSPEPGPWFLAVPGHPIYAYPAWLEASLVNVVNAAGFYPFLTDG